MRPKVTAELAKSLRVITIPWTIQNVSTLLDCGTIQGKRGNPLMDTDDENKRQASLLSGCFVWYKTVLWLGPDCGP